MTIPKEYYVRWVHGKCKETAIYVNKWHISGELLGASDFIRIDGTYPKPTEGLLCGSCGLPITCYRPPYLIRKKRCRRRK